MTNTTIKFEMDLPDQVAYDIMTTAAEGGIGYWAAYGVERRADLYVTKIINIRDGEEYPSRAAAEAADGLYTCDASTIADGINLAFHYAVNVKPSQWVDLCILILQELSGYGGSLDAGDCDTIVQLGLFGTVVYG